MSIIVNKNKIKKEIIGHQLINVSFINMIRESYRLSYDPQEHIQDTNPCMYVHSS